MRLAVISDIHGNLDALERVLADLTEQGGADLTWCLGDLALFGPQPAACVQRIKALAAADEGKTFKVIGGNTDRYMVNGERPRWPSAKDEAAFQAIRSEWQRWNSAFLWCVDQISFDDYQYLAQIRGQELAHKIDGYGHVIGYHAVPGDDEAFLTPESSDEEAADVLLDREGRLAIGGHIHRQFDRSVRGWRIINVGSIGMPFDQKGQASYAMLTFEQGEVQVDLRRVAFDVEAVIEAARALDYPQVDWLAVRLRP